MPSGDRNAARQHNLSQRLKAAVPATSSISTGARRHDPAPGDRKQLHVSQVSDNRQSKPKDDRHAQRASASSDHEDTEPTYPETFLFRPSISEDIRQNASSYHPRVTSSNRPVTSARNYTTELGRRYASDIPPTEAAPTRPGSVLQANVTVIGAAKVGKSNFIKAASATEDGRTLSDTVSIVVDRCLCKLTFLEVASESLDDRHDHDGAPGMDKERADHHRPRGRQHSGTIILYDVMNEHSLSPVPYLLKTCRTRGEPVVLVAAKCDNPAASREVRPDHIADKARTIIPNIQVFESALNERSSSLAAVQALLTIVGSQVSTVTTVRSRPRSESAAIAVVLDNPGGPLVNSSKASLELAAAPQQVGTAPEPSDYDLRSKGLQAVSSASRETVAKDHQRQRSASNPTSEPPSRPSGWIPGSHSFLNLDDQSSSEVDESDGRGSEDSGGHEPCLAGTPATFSDLVAILLRPLPRNEDFDYMQTFLAFYRLFAPPSALLDAILLHYESITENVVTPWDHETVLDHDIAVIDAWIKQYPGDFAKHVTRHKLEKFLSDFVPSATTREPDIGAGDSGYFSANIRHDDKNRAAAARQIKTALENVAEDEDTDWACTDTDAIRPRPMTTPRTAKPLSEGNDVLHPNQITDLTQVAKNNSKYDHMLLFGGQSTLTIHAFGGVDRDSPRSSISAAMNIAISAQRQASLLTFSSARPLDKNLWRFVIEQGEDTIARELTRMDWILFSAIRPRALIRHATGPPSSSTVHVSQVNDHFNHLAYWVTNLILFRDKPKHRSQMLEKLMRVAKKLRRVNNYNALAAFVAAIRGPAIARLSMTRDLVDATIQKKFASFEVLMSTARGHWAYRFALNNTEEGDHPRIPFLPLHRRDLIVAESAGKTFVSEDAPYSGDRYLTRDSSTSSTCASDNSSVTLTSSKSGSTDSSATLTSSSATPLISRRKVNWPKFAVMGETLTVLRKAQSTPYSGFAPNEAIKAALLDVKLCKNDDQLWERSLALEAGGATAVADSQKAQVKRRIQGGIEKLRGVGRDP